ncbi:MAG: hypothetical protein IH586_18315, partial [Anaerolineaceae bacterium]|nr:hypothetical protein [Anaerolineaceae bacterium]
GNIGITGAGIYSAGVLTITNSTIHDNRGTSEIEDVAGIVVQPATSITFNNTIISGHTDKRVNCVVAGATVYSNGHNLSQDSTCNLTPDPLVGIDPLLGSFDYHGGSTKLFSLASSSPAIDAGANAECPSTDQRGVNYGRPADGGSGTATCDIGAYEADAIPAKHTFLPTLFR